MNKAIKLAIEKGGYYVEGMEKGNYAHFQSDTFHILNPEFWQALGKALGWGECLEKHHWTDGCHPGHITYPAAIKWKDIAAEYFKHRMDKFSSIRSEQAWWEDLINE